MRRVFERDGKVVLARGDFEEEIDPLLAHRLGYALMECSRFSVSTETGDVKRTRVWEFVPTTC